MRYSIAGLEIECTGIPPELKSFKPFECSGGTPVMHFDCSGADISDRGELTDEFSNDAGHVRLYRTSAGYLILLRYNGGPVHAMSVNRDFSEAHASIRTDDPEAGTAVSSMVRLAFSQRILLFRGIFIHASCVTNGGAAYMFLGKSGTGKSTHSRMWLENVPGTELLNDDNPVIRVIDGKAIAFGSPWSGKTDCYRNECAPLGGIARVSRSDTDFWENVEGVKAWTTIFPSCSRINQDDLLYLPFVETLNLVVSSVRAGIIHCKPDAEAAKVAYKNLKVPHYE